MTAPHPAADISVVVPTYNRGDLIAETLETVLAQDLPAREIIVVDDGSQDDTAALLAGYAPAVRTIRIPNSGDMVARNTGLRAASGRLVAFCDSDDLWRPGFLSAMAALWAREPGLTAAYGDFVVIRDGAWLERSKFHDAPPAFWDGLRDLAPMEQDPTGLAATGLVPNGLAPPGGVFDRPFVARLLAFQPFFPSCMVVDRQAFLAAGGWDEGVSRIIGCDFATALRVAERPPVGILRQPLVGIRKHGGNISADVAAMNLGDARVLEYVLRTRPSLAPLEHAVRDSIAARRRDALDSAFAQGDFAAVQRIHALIPPLHRPLRQQIKQGISRLPPPLNRLVAAWLSGG